MSYKTTFIPIDYDYFDWQGRNYAKITGRNTDGKRICIIDSCDVYLWAILEDGITEKNIEKLISKVQNIELDVKGRKTKVEKVLLENKNFLGKPVKALKIFATNYKDLHDIADKLDMKEIVKRRGYDLGYITHYIIERKLLPLTWYELEGELLNNSQEFGGMDSVLNVDICIKLNKFQQLNPEKPIAFNPKVLAFDLEADSIELGKGEILMISLVNKDFKKVLTWKKCRAKNLPDYAECLKSEDEVIEKFVEYVKKISPDFLVGYFSDGFDLPYLKSRAEFHKIKLDLGLDSSQISFSRGNELTAKIDGIVHVDLLKFIETAYSQYMQSETLSLNEVAKEFLGDEKKQFRFQHSSKISDDEWEKYIEYNLHDSVLAYRLFEKFWHDIQEFSKVVKEPAFNITRNGMSKNVESFILHNLEKYNEIPEKKPTYDEIGERRLREKYEGAFVLEPVPGLYENLAMFDFTSFWPSIIATFNLSKSTLLEKKEKDATETEVLGKKIYFSKKPGFFPEMLKEIILLRKKFKEQLKTSKEDAVLKARSNAFKLLANASYGYMGFFGARYYCPEASGGATALSRDFIKKTIDSINNHSYKTIYSDTDSIAFLMSGKSKNEVINLLKNLNNSLPGIMELELDGFFKRGIWVTTRAGIIGAKKKYALIDENNKLKIRGFETVRRDWCKLAREVQNNVIKMILEDGNEKRALEYVKNIMKQIKKREISKENLIIKTQLKKPLNEYKAISPHVIAAKKMIEKKIPVDAGALIEYFIAETREKKSLIREMVKLPDEKGEYNIKYYLEHQILPAIENIFQVFNINIQELVDDKKQMKLF